MARRFPVRLHKNDAVVAIRLPKPMTTDTKRYLRKVAKSEVGHLYHLSIETGIFGRTGNGVKIPINSVGRWLFGTPGYIGHLRVNAAGRDCKVEYPAQSPDVVHRLIAATKEKVEAISSPSSTPMGEGVHEQAWRLGKARYPDVSVHKLAAFANSVACLVTGMSGGYGGPSVREHAASRLYAERAGSYEFGKAIELLLRRDGPIFGPLTKLHRACWDEGNCFDDDPMDVDELETLAAVD